MIRFTRFIRHTVLTVVLTAVFVFGGLLVIGADHSREHTFTTSHHPSTGYKKPGTTDPRERKPKKHTSFQWYPDNSGGNSSGNSSSIRFR